MICAGCTLLMFITIGLTTTTFSVYLPYIIDSDNLTNTQISLINTIRSLSSLCALFIVDWYYRSGRIRMGAVASVVAVALSFAIFGLSKDFFGYCIGSIISGAAYSLGGMVPTAILINRWFGNDWGTALGICAAGTGVCAIIIPPLVAGMIDSLGLHQVFFIEALTILLLSVLLLLILRENPHQSEPHQFREESIRGESKQKVKVPIAVPRAYFIAVMFAMMLLGAASDPAYVHISVLYDTEGYDLGTITFLLSLASILTIGMICCSLAPKQNMLCAYVAMICVGIGLSTPTVGLSIWAYDMSGLDGYTRTIKKFQIFNSIGKVIFCSVPGIIADLTGSYAIAYVIFTAFSLTILVILQFTYARCIIPARASVE